MATALNGCSAPQALAPYDPAPAHTKGGAMTIGTRPQIGHRSAPPRRIGLHPISTACHEQAVVIVDADHPASSVDCIELIVRAWPDARVTRRETGKRLSDDPVLAAREGPAARFVAHWIVRLAALARGFGPTDTILIHVPRTPATIPLLDRMLEAGAQVALPPATLH